MGTRSLTRVWDKWTDKDGKPHKVCLVAMYRQMDGYLSGHGKDLKEFLKDMRICNGIGAEQEKGKWANRIDCLAAQLVAHFKQGIGGIYLVRAEDEQEYVYDIEENTNGELVVTVTSSGEELFSGLIRNMPVED